MERVQHKVMKTRCAQVSSEAAAQSLASHECNPVIDGPERSVGQVSAYAKRAMRWLRAMVLAVAVSSMPTAIAQGTPLPPTPPIPVEQMHAFGYTKEFAKRFALPEPEPGWEPGDGLLAVEFSVRPIPGPWRPLYTCAFKLYIDSKFDIAFPEPGLSGLNELYTSRTHPFIARRKNEPDIPEADRRAHGERQRAFGQLAAVATSDYVMDKSGALTSSPLLEFVRELFPGVHYVQASDCMFAFWLSRRESDLNVWVKKSTGKDYTRTAMRDPNDFYQFPLPHALIAKARPWAEWVSQNNHFIHEEEAREQRERHYVTRNREPTSSGTK